MSELKPCPFCGGEAEIIRMGTGRVSMQIGCTDCGAWVESGETFISDSCKWNTRTSEWRPLELENRQLREEVQRLVKALTDETPTRNPPPWLHPDRDLSGMTPRQIRSIHYYRQLWYARPPWTDTPIN